MHLREKGVFKILSILVLMQQVNLLVQLGLVLNPDFFLKKK